MKETFVAPAWLRVAVYEMRKLVVAKEVWIGFDLAVRLGIPGGGQVSGLPIHVDEKHSYSVEVK